MQNRGKGAQRLPPMNPLEVFKRDEVYFFTPQKDYILEVGDYFKCVIGNKTYYGKITGKITGKDSYFTELVEGCDPKCYTNVRFHGLTKMIKEGREGLLVRSKEILI